MIPPLVVHCGFGILLTLMTLPLVLRKIPMNRAYGIRIAEAFASERHWYEINAYGGKLFLVFGILLTAFGLVFRDAAPPVTSLWSPVFIVGPLLLALVPVFPIRAYARWLR